MHVWLYTRGIFIAYQKRKKNPVSETTRVNESIQQIKMIASNRLTSSPRLEIRENLKDYLYLNSPHYFPEYALGVEMKKSDSNWATPKRPSLFFFTMVMCDESVLRQRPRRKLLRALLRNFHLLSWTALHFISFIVPSRQEHFREFGYRTIVQ